MKKLLLFLLLIPNLVMAELTPKPKGKPVITEVHQEPIKPMPYCDRFPYSDRCVSCTSDTILTSAKKIDGITFLIKTTETRLAKDHKFCYRYNNDSTKDVYEDQPRKKTEFMIMDLDNRMLEHKHVDDSAFAKPIKLIESSRDFPYTIISTQTFGVSNVNNTHYIYRTNPSFKKIAVLKAGEPNINFYKSNGAYLFEVVSLNPTGGPRSDWTYEVETFALINDELTSIDKRLIGERKERYDICANENFMTLDCYLSDKHKRSDRAIKPIPIQKPITKPIPKEIKPLPEGFAPIII